MSTAEALMTAEEFGQRPDPGHREELVQGQVIDMPPADPTHGYVCLNAGYLLRDWLKNHDVGRAMSNDSGVITERGPDTVRGADVSYYSFDRVPRGPMSRGYFAVAPELVFEIRSPSDRWREILEKVLEYLKAGVLVVIILDPETQLAHVYGDDEPRILNASDELALPGVLEGFRVRVGQFFE